MVLPKNHVVLFTLSVLFVSNNIHPCLSKVVIVRIANRLDGDSVLHCRCKSKDDDLGNRAIPHSGDYKFSFGKSFWGDTIFWCNMRWNDRDGKSHGGAFKVYWMGGLFTRSLVERFCSDGICVWKAKNDGLYLIDDRKGKSEKIYDWEW